MVISLIPMAIFTASADVDGYYTYTIENNEATITKCNFNISGAVKVPETLGGCTVTGIGIRAFFNCDGIKEIIIPNSVKVINNEAFYECSNLEKITLPDGITEISDSMFMECQQLKNITIPNTVKRIGISSFQLCSSLEEVVIPRGVEVIDTNAFSLCSNLKKITFPKSIKSLGDYVLGWGEALIEIYYEGTEEDEKNIQTTEETFYLEELGLHYNSCVGDHKYSAKCDTSCNKCEYTRTASKHNNKTKTKVATTKSNGKTWKECKKCGEITETKTIYKIKTIKIKQSEFTYNGKTKKPKLIIKDSKGKTIPSKYYTVNGTKSAKNVGKYELKVVFKGNYSGTKTLTFKINPPKTTVSKLTAKTKSLKVSITKKSSGVTGYQIQYSTSKSFKNAKIKTITSYKTTSYTIKKLSAKKTYYVRVRTYKTVDGKKFYSDWSSAKSKKTK